MRRHLDVPRPAIVGAALVGLVLVLLAARSSVTPDVSLARRSSPATVASSPAPTPTPATPPTAAGAQPRNTHGLPTWLTVLLWLAAALIVAAVAVLLARLAARAIRRLPAHGRGRRRRGPVAVAPDDVARTLTDALDEGLVRIERGSASDAIIACWVQLEEAAARSGVPPRPAETAAELAERVLRACHARREPLDRLAELYREARFSRHAMDERSRRQARACLELVRDELVGDEPPVAVTGEAT